MTKFFRFAHYLPYFLSSSHDQRLFAITVTIPLMATPSTAPNTNTHIQRLDIYALGARVVATVLVYISTYLPLFDSSPLTSLHPASLSTRWISSLLRWDALHFVSVAQYGYIYEYQWAFLPGVPTVMKIGGSVSAWLRRNDDRAGSLGYNELLVAGALGALVCGNVRVFYKLSLHHLKSPNLAFLAALLSLLPGSPAVVYHTGYTEPFFTFLSYKGRRLHPGILTMFTS